MGTESSQMENLSSPPGGGRESVLSVLKEILGDLRDSQASPGDKGASTLRRYRDVVGRKAPRLHKSLRFISSDLMHWMNRGGPWRAFLILSTGLITLIGLTGVVAFLLFLVTATVNAVVVALLATVAAVGAVTAFFFAALTAVYIGALVCAAFTISTIAFFSVAAVLTAAGWIGFFWIIWLGVKKTLQLVQGSLGFTVSTLQSFSQPNVIVVKQES